MSRLKLWFGLLVILLYIVAVVGSIDYIWNHYQPTLNVLYSTKQVW